MTQETGETRDAIIEDDNKRIETITSFHKDYKDPYWIVIFAKPYKQQVDGKPTLVQHIKPYFQRPPSAVGMIIGEVNNSTGNIRWEINMPQRPFDFNALQLIGGKPCDEVVVETTSIPGAYITK
jgi:hypothetical protein